MDWLRSRWEWIVRNKFLTYVIVFAVGFLVFGTMMDCRHWGWIVTESGSTIIRNLGLVIGGLIAIGLAYWRSIVASRQTKASQQQTETSQRGLLNERYQKGAEMLGSEVLSVRLGGIYALQRLAEEDPERYHVQITHLLCTFVSHPTGDKDYMAALRDTEQQQLHRLREDVQTAMKAIGTRSKDDMELEKQGDFSLILDGAHLTGAILHRAILTEAHLTGAHLDGAHLAGAHLDRAYLNRAILTGAHLTSAILHRAYLNRTHLAGADLDRANLTGANLTGANLTSAHLNAAILTGADFSEAKGLTQKQLDQAWADPGNPPQLGGLCDVETGEPLEWRGQPCRK